MPGNHLVILSICIYSSSGSWVRRLLISNTSQVMTMLVVLRLDTYDPVLTYCSSFIFYNSLPSTHVHVCISLMYTEHAHARTHRGIQTKMFPKHTFQLLCLSCCFFKSSVCSLRSYSHFTNQLTLPQPSLTFLPTLPQTPPTQHHKNLGTVRALHLHCFCSVLSLRVSSFNPHC